MTNVAEKEMSRGGGPSVAQTVTNNVAETR